jgi:uncharacterized membrane protein YccC
MSSTSDMSAVPSRRRLIVEVLNDEGANWMFVFKLLLALFITGWLAMRFAMEQPTTAMFTVAIVMHRQSGMVLAKSFYRALGTLAGAAAALVIVGLFPQERVLFLGAIALWVGLCSGGAALYRNFKAYAFVLAGYTAVIVVLPAITHPLVVFDSAVSRIGEVLLGVLVSGVVSDVIFPSRLRDDLRRATNEQFAHFIAFVGENSGGAIAREAMGAAQLRFVREAVTLEDLRASVIFEDPEARARSGRMQLFNQRFMTASTSFQTFHHLLHRLQRSGHGAVAEALIELYAPISEALALPVEAGQSARALLPRLVAYRENLPARAAVLRQRSTDSHELSDFDTGDSLLRRFAVELRDYVDAATMLQAPQWTHGAVEIVRFARGNDFAGAGLAMLRSVLTVGAVSLFWLASAWPYGPIALLVATVFSGLFASAPNPVQLTSRALLGVVFTTIGAFICQFFVLAKMDGFVLLMAGLSPFLMIGAYMSVKPKIAFIGIGYLMGFFLVLTISNPQTYNVLAFINNATAVILGMATAAIAFVIVPPVVGSAWQRRRQVDRLRNQIALVAEAPLEGLRERFQSFNSDLVLQIATHTVPGSDESRKEFGWALSVREVGRAVIELRYDAISSGLPQEACTKVSEATHALGQLYNQPTTAHYLAARDAIVAAIAAATAILSSHPVAGRLLDHLHLIRIVMLDDESVLAQFVTPIPATTEIAHAP